MLWSFTKHACDPCARGRDGKDQEDVEEGGTVEARKKTHLGRGASQEGIGRVGKERGIARGVAAGKSGVQTAERDGHVLEMQRGRNHRMHTLPRDGTAQREEHENQQLEACC